MMQHGVTWEPKIKKIVEKQLGLRIFEVGLVINKKYPFLGA